MSEFSLDTLNRIIAARTDDCIEKSYTASLIAMGTQCCAKKFGEEAVEAVIAATTGNRDDLVNETADVLYHLLVMLKSENIALEEVMLELASRTAQSGHQEKASR